MQLTPAHGAGGLEHAQREQERPVWGSFQVGELRVPAVELDADRVGYAVFDGVFDCFFDLKGLVEEVEVDVEFGVGLV